MAHHDTHRHQPAAGPASAGAVVEIHPDDAVRFASSMIASQRVVTDYGQCTLKVAVSERQQRGMLFAPIHWSEANASTARVGALVAPFHRIRFRTAENKATRHRSCRMNMFFAVLPFTLATRDAAAGPQVWWTRVAVRGYGYLFATTPIWRDGNPGCGLSPADDLAEYKIWAVASIARHRSRRSHRNMSIRRSGTRCRRLGRGQAPVRRG